MTEIPTEDEFMSMVRRHEVAACGIKKDDTRTHETTLAALTQAKRDLLYAFDAQAARIAGLKHEVARLRIIEQRLDWYMQNCPVGMLLEDAKLLLGLTKEATDESES